MSQNETHKGILKLFPRLEAEERDVEYLTRFLFQVQKKQINLHTWQHQDDIADYFGYEEIENVVYYENNIYINECHVKLDEGWDTFFVNTDRGIEYLVNFYNGGTYLEEVLGDVIEQANK